MKYIPLNEFSKEKENTSSFLKRLFIYQKERFPLLGHGLLVIAFSFSAISYSRICRGLNGFVKWDVFLVGVFTTVSLFLLVRIFDEFKDAKDDSLYRKDLPVPRGLVSLKELKIVGIIVVCLQIIVNLLFFPKMLIIYAVIIAYLSLMGKEFFIPKWLKKHQFFYITSHMFIIPLIDIYSSGLDWLLDGVTAPKGLIFFFAVSYMNGIVLEIGRKIRTKENEAEGVLTYSSMLGANKAVVLWLFVLFVTFCLATAASFFAGYGNWALITFGVLWIASAIPGLMFIRRKSKKISKAIEITSGLWTIFMYLTLGGIPMIQKLIAA